MRILFVILALVLILSSAGCSDFSANLVGSSGQARMLAFGDLMLGRDVARLMELNGEDYPFQKIFGSDGIDAQDFDLVMANLEGPLLKAKKRRDLTPIFAFDPDLVPALLKKYGFNLVSLANNHTWDHSAQGWESTLESLHRFGISTVGNPMNMFEYDVYETQLNDVRLGFIGINEVNFPVDWEEAKRKVKELKERNDFVILVIHWGDEYKTIANFKQRDKGHGMVDAGVDLIIGHHPHVVQDHEVFLGKNIYYSLGNFVFDQYWSKAVQSGLALDILFQKGGDILVQEIPFRIQRGQPSLQ
ncbi:MAG: CapA family protein [bacterium]|nr:CapA family protein [bacterium]